ncbi:MAG: hypothetical protein J6V33_09175, partial [Bacteroidales bacterium]|nr:hypothetical protein [Bacteroidales bacterium]
MKRISLFLCLAVLVTSMQIKAQSACDGLHNPMNFNHWYGKTGKRSTGVSTSTNIFNTSASSNVEIPWTQLASITTVGSCGSNCGQGSNPDNNLNRFQIITQQGSDANTGGALQRIPPGATSVIRLGDMCSESNYSAEALFYEYQVNANNALIFIDYAVVLEAPTHGATGNPEFIIRVCEKNQNGTWQNAPINDSLYYIIQAPNGLTNLPLGWSGYTASSSCKFVYKPWTKVAINLNEFLYKDVRLEIYISDCNAEFHGAYCYISGTCQPMKLMASDCAAGDATHVATISAPKGLDTYRWQRKNVVGNWEDITGATDSILLVQTTDFYLDNTGNRVATNEFKCIMTSALDPSKPITSYLQTTVNN